MRFQSAVISMNAGQRVTRALWGPGRWLCARHCVFMVRTHNGGLVPWQPRGTEFFEDVNASDWMPVTAEDAAPVIVRDEEPR